MKKTNEETKNYFLKYEKKRMFFLEISFLELHL